MAPQTSSGYTTSGMYMPELDPGDEVVISGVAGRFPMSDSINELRENLFNKVDMITDNAERWEDRTLGAPSRFGMVNNLQHFDQPFFRIGVNQVQSMDPMVRMLHEIAYEAIVDAGFNPKHFSNRNVAVYSAITYGETEMLSVFAFLNLTGLILTGCCRSMFANRISYSFNFTGPSCMIDGGVSGSINAIEHAYRAVRDGRCEAAIVATGNLCLAANVGLQYLRRGILSPDGVPRPFDENCNGMVRSEALSVLFIQKARDAKRVYCNVVHCKIGYEGNKQCDLMEPSFDDQLQFLKKFYKECDVDPQSVDYVEANACGLKKHDTCEVSVLDKIFKPTRSSPLLVGSIQSNLGTPDAATGVCAIIKSLITMEGGEIPPNINYSTPLQNSEPLLSGRIQVVTERTPFNGKLIAINSFSSFGTLSHILLRRYDKKKVNDGLPTDSLPRLVVVSGRTEEAVMSAFGDIQQRPIDTEYLSLLNDVHTLETPGHLYRGFAVLKPKGTAAVDVKYFSGAHCPVWFVFSGMGSQWAGMGKSLMQIPVFARAIANCDKILKPKGVDIVNIITTDDPTIFDYILNCFVGIAAIQIGLVDILTAMNIVPDGLIGHSVGELGCAYADGSFTADQMIMASYYRGLTSAETQFIHGSMAAVGLGYKQIKYMCPPEIEVACHNSRNSVTISGPSEEMKTFVSELQKQKIFAKEVNCAHIAYHSRYIASAGSTLLNYLKQVIPEPKRRSEKWFSTSIPESKWDSDIAKFSSAEYHTNNLLNPVLFEESSAHIPSNAITIEIAPHGLLQAILKRSLHKDTLNVALTRRGSDSVQELLEALGKLYAYGVQMDVPKLYPPMKYPVSSGTPMTGQIIKWEHSEEWHVPTRDALVDNHESLYVNVIDTNSDEYKLFGGQIIDGRKVLPATACLVLAWENFINYQPEYKTLSYFDVSIVFENLRFHRPVIVPKNDHMELLFIFRKVSGEFEIFENNLPVLSGHVCVPEEIEKEMLHLEPHVPELDTYVVPARDIYKQFRVEGCNYSDQFRTIISMDSSGLTAQVQWKNNWITYLDSLLQLHILNLHRGMYLPRSIEKITIDAQKRKQFLETQPTNEVLPVNVYKNINFIQSAGVEMRGIRFDPITHCTASDQLILEHHQFVPHCSSPKQPLDLQQVLRVCISLILENQPPITAQGIELSGDISDSQEDLIFPSINNILNDIPSVKAKIALLYNLKELAAYQKCHFILGSNLIDHPDVLKSASKALLPCGGIIARERSGVDVSNLSALGLQIVLDKTAGAHRILLLKKKTKPDALIIIPVMENDSIWVPSLKSALLDVHSPQRVILFSQGEPFNGILGLFNCIRKEKNGEVVRCFFIHDDKAPMFDPQIPLYRTQLDKDLPVNVLIDGEWGSYCYLPIQTEPSPKVHHIYNASAEFGNLNSLTWFSGSLNSSRNPAVYPGRELVHVHWSALNFEDVLFASGCLPVNTSTCGPDMQECVQGLEFSGCTAKGQRVMGIVPGYGISNLVDTDNKFLWNVPQNWTMEDAATVPLAYATALYALVIVGKMKKGESVLIHSGCGGIGQAAIRLALHHGLTVYTTVSSPEKKEFIKKQFPQIKENHISSSRDASFQFIVMNETNGVGVDLVINSLVDKLSKISVDCLAPYGRFLQIGELDLVRNNELGLSTFIKQTSFISILLRSIFSADDNTKEKLHELLQDAINQGAVKPLCRTVFGKDEVQQAYRHMTTGQCIGKVLIRIQSGESKKVSEVPVRSRFLCHPRQTYVVVGSLDGYGLELANWLVKRGARQLVLTSHKGITSGYQKQYILSWKSQGVNTYISKVDVHTAKGVKTLLTEAKSSGPISSIFHIGDAEPHTSTQENLLAMTVRRLDTISRKLCPDLQHFVAFSNTASGRGEARQTALAMAGCAAERVCEARSRDGLPALAIQLCPVQELLTDDSCDTMVQSLASTFLVLDNVLSQQHAVVSSIPHKEKSARDTNTVKILEYVAKLLGFATIQTLLAQKDTLLLEMGLDFLKAGALHTYLQDEAGLYILSLHLQKLNIMALKSMINVHIQYLTGSPDELHWLRHLVTAIPKEQASYSPLVELPSGGNLGSPLFCVPGVVNIAENLKPLSQCVARPTFALQCGTNIQDRSIQEIAEKLLPHVTAHLAPGQPFALLGHSLGGLLVLELAAALEQEGRRGRVILLDGTPELLRQLCGSKEESDKMHLWLLTHLLTLLGQHDASTLNKVRQEMNTSSDRKGIFSKNCPPNTSHSNDYLTLFADTTCELINTAATYRWEHANRLNSPVLLLRPSEATIPGFQIDNMLSTYCQGDVEVQIVEGSHASIVENPATGHIINKFLS